MNLQTFGRNLLDVLADRTLSMLRATTYEDLRGLVQGPTPAASPPSMAGPLAAFAAGAAVGMGVTALTTPLTGSELRERVAASVRSVRAQAEELGRAAVAKVHDAQLSLTPAPPTRRRAGKSDANGRSARARKSAPVGDRHA